MNELIKNEPGAKVMFLGNEAIARGVLESGVGVAAAYPGTPSSEIVNALAQVSRETGQYVEWSTNEKVAFECAAGAAFLGIRSFSAMKGVGLNVAMDPLMVVNICGVQGGFVFLVADDPDCWSTQNEQDSRLLGQAAEIPCFEPSSVQEAKDMMPYAYDVSEKLGRAVMVRTVTRLNHSRAPVTLGPIRRNEQVPQYYALKSGFPALPKHVALHQELPEVEKALADCPFNKVEVEPGACIGVIASGNSVNYAREALTHLNLTGISILKLAVVNPVPRDLIREFLQRHETVVVFEEIEPLIESHVLRLVYDLDRKPKVIGKLSGHLDVPGELTVDKAARVMAEVCGVIVSDESLSETDPNDEVILPRIPGLCAGCPHMGSFYSIHQAAKKSKVRTLVSGDIGCYGIGLNPPYNLFDSHICMGASIGIGNGFAATGYDGPVICVIGDSTFYHTGMPALINAVFNGHNITVVIVDNQIIAMTGHQPDPGTGRTAMGKPAVALDIVDVVRACGVDYVKQVDAFQAEETIAAIRDAAAFDGPAVVVTKGECALLKRRRLSGKDLSAYINPEKCDACSICSNLLFCPALMKGDDHFHIDQNICTGCGLCMQVCPNSAISLKGE